MIGKQGFSEEKIQQEIGRCRKWANVSPYVLIERSAMLSQLFPDR